MKPRNASPAWNGLREDRECRAVGQSAKAMSASKFWNISMSEFPGVGEDGMPGRNVQRKLGTTRGSPRRSRTAKASRISRHAVKSRCAREWGGWGRLSDDGPGHYNPDPSEGPWGRWSIPPHGGAGSSPQARLRADHRSDHEMHEGWMQTGWRTANVGSRLKPPITQEGTARTASLPSARINPEKGDENMI